MVSRYLHSLSVTCQTSIRTTHPSRHSLTRGVAVAPQRPSKVSIVKRSRHRTRAVSCVENISFVDVFCGQSLWRGWDVLHRSNQHQGTCPTTAQRLSSMLWRVRVTARGCSHCSRRLTAIYFQLSARGETLLSRCSLRPRHVYTCPVRSALTLTLTSTAA
jgi:hypothetical protein